MSLKVDDNWKSYCEAMEERFRDKFEPEDSYDKMWEEKYAGNIQTYVDKIRTMNLRVHVSGLVLKKAVKKGLPKEIRQRLSAFKQSPIDEVWLDQVVEAGRDHEEWCREEGIKIGNAGQERDSQSSSKKKRGKKGKDSSDPLKPNTSGSKVEKKKGKKADGKQTSGFKKLHESREEALKGIAQSLLDKRAKEDVCLRCGKEGHRWYKCRGEIVTASARKVAGQKRSRTSEAAELEAGDDGSSPKKAKVAARTWKEASGEDLGSWRRKVYELDSEEE
jgi:hypothetical protein